MTTILSSGYNNETRRYERRLSDGTVEVRRFAAVDADGNEIGRFAERDVAAGACQDAAREDDSDGEGYEVREVFVPASELEAE